MFDAVPVFTETPLTQKLGPKTSLKGHQCLHMKQLQHEASKKDINEDEDNNIKMYKIQCKYKIKTFDFK